MKASYALLCDILYLLNATVVLKTNPNRIQRVLCEVQILHQERRELEDLSWIKKLNWHFNLFLDLPLSSILLGAYGEACVILGALLSCVTI
jgi:hypothetical protein